LNTHTNNRPLRRIVAFGALAAVLMTACGGDSGSGGPAAQDRPERIERLRRTGTDSGYPSPFGYVRGPGWILAGYIFDTLLWEDATGEPIPWLAREWSHSEDGLTWRFTIRDGVRFHDGTPLTAEDVKFTFDYLTTGPGEGQSSLVSNLGLQTVEVEPPNTVVFTLAEPSATFEERVAMRVLITPRHIWESVQDPAAYRDPKALIGSGPYKLVSYDEAAGTYLFEANEDFYLGTPFVRRLELVPATDELIALQRGEIDVAGLSEDPVPPTQLQAFENNPQYGKLEQPGDWNLALHFNLSRGFPYDRVEFRQAVAYAIDRKDLVSRILFGRGQPASTGGLSPDHEMGAQGLPTYDRNVERARQMLDGLGLRDANGDGFRELPDGSPWVQELQSSSRFSADTPQLVKEHLREVGINVEVTILDRATADSNAGQGNYTMALVGYGGLAGDADGLRTRFMPSRSQSFSTAKGYNNERFNALAREQAATLDRAERRDLVVEMQEIIAEDLPIFGLYVPHRTAFYNTALFDGYYYTPGCSPCGVAGNKHMLVTGRKTGFAS
jgi:peptide/nickel transport system substrate-binding protein